MKHKTFILAFLGSLAFQVFLGWVGEHDWLKRGYANEARITSAVLFSYAIAAVTKLFQTSKS
jgi:hypothetical protein